MDKFKRPAPPTGGSRIPLRGPIGLETQGARPAPAYVGDLTDPRVQRFMVKGAGEGRARILPNPANCLTVAPPGPGFPARMAAFAAGVAPDRGPRVTFVNDERGRPPTDRPIRREAAQMLAGAILASGLGSVNINSSQRAPRHPGDRSQHIPGEAADINRVNGQPVGFGARGRTWPNPDPKVVADVRALQEALRRQPLIRENFGPVMQEKRWTPQAPPQPAPSTRATHGNHVHASVQPAGRR